jgi:hypothetical protein
MTAHHFRDVSCCRSQLLRATIDKAQREHNESTLASTVALKRTFRNRCDGPCVDGCRVGKSFFHDGRLGRCSHVFGLLVRYT